MDIDTNNERERYDKRAERVLRDDINLTPCGYEGFDKLLQQPYISYYDKIFSCVHKNSVVIELGAGDGQHSLCIAKNSDYFTATDISPASLELLKSRLLKEGAAVDTTVADMSNLPFEDNSVDVVTSAGSLSYADPAKVDAEIIRVLKPNGVFICVDSLNHNPIYKINRYIHYLRGRRTKSTLKRMPTLKRLHTLEQHFHEAGIDYFGSISFVSPVLCKILGNSLGTKIPGFFDQISVLNRMAFKFVLCASNPINKT